MNSSYYKVWPESCLVHHHEILGHLNADRDLVLLLWLGISQYDDDPSRLTVVMTPINGPELGLAVNLLIINVPEYVHQFEARLPNCIP